MLKDKQSIANLAMILAYFAAASASLYIVLESPLGQMNVNMPWAFLPLYLAATFILLLLVGFSKLGTTPKILLVVIHSLVSHLYFTIQFYPSIGGDPWSQLAYEKSIEKGWFMTYVVLDQSSFATQVYMAVRDLAQYLLVITLSSIFSIDIYWVHILFMPVLWSVFVPPIAFAVAKQMGVDEKASLLAGLLAGVGPSFIIWGSVSVPNSLGFLVFFFCLYCFVKNLSSGEKRYFILALVGVVLSVLAHFMTGVAAISLFFVYVASKEYRQSTVAALTSIGSATVAILAMPFSLLAQRYIYPLTSSFTLNKVLTYDAYQLILANYASMTGPELLTNGIFIVLGVVGLFLLFRKKDGKSRMFLVVAFLTFVVQYLFVFYFVSNPPFSPLRLWGFRDLILMPLAAMVIVGLLDLKWSSNTTIIAGSATRLKGLGRSFRKAIFVVLILVTVSLLISDGVFRYYNYERYFTPGGRITTAELQAINAIQNEYLSTNENYVVVSDHSMSLWGSGVVGAFNPHQVYLVWDDQFFKRLVQSPTESQSILSGAVSLAESRFNQTYGLVYFIASKPLVEYYTNTKYTDLVSILSGNFDTFYLSPDNEIQVFVWTVPFFPHTGFGPELLVVKDGVSTSMRTSYYYETRDDVRYYLGLNGSSRYAITNWPLYWRFAGIRPLPTNRTIDASTWINFTASPESTFVIDWFANEFYKDKIIWRDDSFFTGWNFYYAYGGLNIGNFTSDGSVATESIEGSPDYYCVFRKEVPLVQNATSLIIRLTGTRNSQYSISLYDNTGKEVYFVYWTAAPMDYEQSAFTLPEGLSIKYIGLYVKTLDGSLVHIYWDYLALSY